MSEQTALKPILDEAIRAGCTAVDVHLRCSYPECGCKQLPRAIAAAITRYEEIQAARKEVQIAD